MADKDFVVKNGLVVNTSFSANSTQFTLATINATSNGFFANTSQIKIGNSSVNATINSTAFTGDAATVGGNTASTLRTYTDTAYTNAMSNTLSRNGSYTGNNTFGGTNTVISSNLNITGTFINVASAFIANSIGAYHTGTVNAASHTTGATGTGTGGISANVTTLWIGNNTINTTITSAGLVVNGTAVVANNTGIWTTGLVNATSYTIGSSFIANSTGAYHTGTVNAATSSVGSVVVANATTLNANGFVVNSTGAYVTGLVNATSYNTGAGYGSATGGAVVNVTTIAVGNSSVNGTITSNATVSYFTGTAYTANNATNLGGVAAASYVQNTDSRTLSGNLTFTGAVTSFSGTNVAITGTNLNVSSSSTFSANVTMNGANVVISGTNTAISSNVTLTGASVTGTSTDVTFRNGTFSGNLVVSGTVVTVNTSQLTVNDNIIELAYNQTTADTVDTGLFSPAGNASAIWYSGIVRQASKSSNSNPYFWIFGSNTNPNTSSTVDTSANSTTGTLQAYLVPYGTGGAFVANSLAVTITANSTVNVNITANSLTLSTALAATSGGTGQSSYATGDLLYASSTTALSKLAVPGSAANGQVLQIANNLPAYGTLDGGTF